MIRLSSCELAAPAELVNPLQDAYLDAQTLFFSRMAAAISKMLSYVSRVLDCGVGRGPIPDLDMKVRVGDQIMIADGS